MSDRCVVCGVPISEGRYCEGCDDLPQLDPFAAVPIDLAQIRKVRRSLSRSIEHLDVLERMVRTARQKAAQQ